MSHYLHIFCLYACVLSHFSCVWLFTTLWNVACQLLCPRDSSGKKTGVGCHALLQGIFLIQGWNPNTYIFAKYLGFPGDISGKESTCQCNTHTHTHTHIYIYIYTQNTIPDIPAIYFSLPSAISQVVSKSTSQIQFATWIYLQK